MQVVFFAGGQGDANKDLEKKGSRVKGPGDQVA